MGDTRESLEDFVSEMMQDIDPDYDGTFDEEPDSKPKLTIEDLSATRLSFVDALRAVYHLFGGAQGVASEWRKTYRTAPTNVQAQMISRLMTALESYGEDTQETDPESIDAIEQEIASLARDEMLNKLPENLRKEVLSHLE